MRDLPARGRAVCTGFIESVTHQPPSEQPFFSAVVVDSVRAGAGSGMTDGLRKPYDRLRVIWLGRTRVPGIEAGVELRLEGMVTQVDGLPAMFNPRYEILSRQEHL
ncbi:hypothetical protein [Paenarthrobacter aurescens]|uniref:hypothetical protein n=1 Tax=Paenarthrobacter aurescens TaxID=43663 RepID=UPI001142C71F|nr:hypothetical protein [Paenarthrobacter aurescens]MDO6143293.1 hypothetical protein [Paenarthrobacter aurescens]MDO6147141.1 hypothetical protein [Paenarthrobacter aurescens]MDO6158385.1 hypothetical protein [Paenarthrobacter aurescens]MDO6162369.1 hypothetical protein [Paenarthrobacter aurescens]